MRSAAILRGIVLGGWIGLLFAAFAGLCHRHDVATLLGNLALAGGLCAGAGGFIAFVATRPMSPGDRMRLLIRQLGEPLTDDDVQQLLIDPVATQ